MSSSVLKVRSMPSLQASLALRSSCSSSLIASSLAVCLLRLSRSSRIWTWSFLDSPVWTPWARLPSWEVACFLARVSSNSSFRWSSSLLISRTRSISSPCFFLNWASSGLGTRVLGISGMTVSSVTKRLGAGRRQWPSKYSSALFLNVRLSLNSVGSLYSSVLPARGSFLAAPFPPLLSASAPSCSSAASPFTRYFLSLVAALRLPPSCFCPGWDEDCSGWGSASASPFLRY
mmetsp:Transcript_14508/g.24764  ORF Transcript_14508/g.24764 Transcript_14508/m.24764 type:complete len:232 (+) Transcript_14508:1430-2125(+)